uniref:RSE1/DDB1/CPSF1 C-terminal domain-containing protein n=1 Tax=Oryza nivara TaxID=4536 RepID=A0A0E0FNN9_ORYNI
MAGDPAAAAAAVGAMRPWNYVVTAHKLTVVARSCVGNFTAPDHLDLSSGRDASDHIGRPTNKGQTDELNRDYNITWMTAVEMLDDYVYIGADNCYNLFTELKRRVGRLLVIGQYHLGDQVNRFHQGPLVMQDPGSEVDQIPTFIFSESRIDSTQ